MVSHSHMKIHQQVHLEWKTAQVHRQNQPDQNDILKAIH